MKQYIVDAFTDKVFAGNPAAVCVTDWWLSDETMQNMAIENNLSETAFAVKGADAYRLRWFTPGGEVELCGHATLATAYVITRFVEPDLRRVDFDTLSGRLTVEKEGDLLTMDFPAFDLKPITITPEIVKALGGVVPREAYFGSDILCVLETEAQVRQVVPDLALMQEMGGVCFHITARGGEYDCVTRSFAPKCGVAEDPVCGRAHCHVIPYWAGQTGKREFVAYQASRRGGVLYCHLEGGRTRISGKAALYAEAEVYL